MKNIKNLFLFLGILLLAIVNNPAESGAKVQAEISGNGEIIEVTGSGKFNIGKDITGFTNYYIGNDIKNPWQASVTRITVSKKNKYFTSVNGVLFNKKITRLVYFPSHKKVSSYTVPDTVKSIDCYAFANNRYLKKVVLNEGIRDIGWDTFKNSNIETVNIPSTVTETGYGCFSGCRKLKSIDNKASLSEIEDNMFRNCISLEKLDLGNFIEKIQENAFYNCGAILNIPAGNKNYITQDGVLYSADMKKLFKYPGLGDGDFILPGTVHSISPYAFTGCRKLKSLELNNYITDFPLSQLNGCTDLEVLSLPASFRSAGRLDTLPGGKPYPADAVYGLTSLKEIKIPKENTYFSVYDNALYSDNYENLWLMPRANKSLKIHKNTHYIFDKYCQNQYTEVTVQDGNKYFSSYKGVLYDKNIKKIKLFPGKLENYEIPDSLKNIDTIIDYVVYEKGSSRSAVKGFNNVAINLKNIDVEKGNKYFTSKNGVLFNKGMTKIYLYPRAKKGQYTIPGTVKEIEDNAFAGAHKLTALTVPSSVKSAGINITGCSLLKKIIFKEGIKNTYMYGGTETDFYGFNSFMEKLQVKNIYLPSTLSNITIESINNDAVFYAYNNKNIYTTWYSEDDAHSIKLISIKNYLTSHGYGCQTDIYK